MNLNSYQLSEIKDDQFKVNKIKRDFMKDVLRYNLQMQKWKNKVRNVEKQKQELMREEMQKIENQQNQNEFKVRRNRRHSQIDTLKLTYEQQIAQKEVKKIRQKQINKFYGRMYDQYITNYHSSRINDLLRVYTRNQFDATISSQKYQEKIENQRYLPFEQQHSYKRSGSDIQQQKFRIQKKFSKQEKLQNVIQQKQNPQTSLRVNELFRDQRFIKFGHQKVKTQPSQSIVNRSHKHSIEADYLYLAKNNQKRNQSSYQMSNLIKKQSVQKSKGENMQKQLIQANKRGIQIKQQKIKGEQDSIDKLHLELQSKEVIRLKNSNKNTFEHKHSNFQINSQQQKIKPNASNSLNLNNINQYSSLIYNRKKKTPRYLY